jgi:hypothetical protein
MAQLSIADTLHQNNSYLTNYMHDLSQHQGERFRHSYKLTANFDLGSQYDRLTDCRNNRPRQQQSFYPCWNHQSLYFFQVLGHTLQNQKQDVVPTEFRFTLNRNGRLTDIQVFGIQDPSTKTQLTNMLKDMEFGYSYRANNEPLVLSVDTRIVAQH